MRRWNDSITRGKTSAAAALAANPYDFATPTHDSKALSDAVNAPRNEPHKRLIKQEPGEKRRAFSSRPP